MTDESLRRRARAGIAATLIVLSLVACGDIRPGPNRARERTVYDFTSAMRWGDFNAAWDFVDPQTRQEHPLTDLEKERFKQYEVSGYTVVAENATKETIDRRIQLDLVNRNTQTPRTVAYREHWRWDPTLKRWWLVSGLPDLSPQP